MSHGFNTDLNSELSKGELAAGVQNMRKSDIQWYELDHSHALTIAPTALNGQPAITVIYSDILA